MLRDAKGVIFGRFCSSPSRNHWQANIENWDEPFQNYIRDCNFGTCLQYNSDVTTEHTAVLKDNPTQHHFARFTWPDSGPCKPEVL